MKLIEKLTPSQEIALKRWHAEWLAHGLSTDRADRPCAERAIIAIRAEIGVLKPPVFIWTDSPATALMALGSLGSSLESSLRSSLRSSLGPSLWSSLESSLGSSLRSSLGSSLRSSLESSLRSSLGSSLWSLESSLGSSLWSSLRSSLRSSLGDAWRGQHESYWIAFYLFCRDVVGVKYETARSKQLDMLADIARSACWWWCYENYVAVSERPTVAKLEAGRLHAQGGPALAFADGWQVHAWRGTRVPAEWIESPATVDPKLALTWENIEQRRALAEIVGWSRVLACVNARTVNEDRPDIGTLIEADLPGSEGARFLRVRCGTGRDFVLPVPRELTTARAANAWTYDLKPHELNLEIRT